MPDLIEEKMKEHLPELITAKARAEFKAGARAHSGTGPDDARGPEALRASPVR